MIEAAKVSLRFGFEHFLQSHEDPDRLRQAVIDIHVGIELLLKERLFRESPLFVLEKIEEHAAIQVHLARQRGLPGRISPKQRTVGFGVALGRLEALGLLPKTVDQVRLARINELRNELIHAGSSQQLDEGLRLIAGEAVSFVGTFMRDQLGMQPTEVFGTNSWTSVEQLSQGISQESERALQKKLARHRERFETLTREEIDDRARRTIDFRGLETTTTQCPACDGDAYVGIDFDDPDFDEDGVAYGGRAVVAIIQCPICEVVLNNDELDGYQDLAQELLREMYAYAEPDDDDRYR